MRNALFALVVTAIFVGAVPVASAAPVGQPIQNLDQLSFSFAAVPGFSWRQVRLKHKATHVDTATSSRLIVRGLFSPARWVDVYGTIGAGDLRMEDPDFESVLGLLYGGGFRVRLFPWFWEETGLFNLELGGQFLGIDTKSGSASKRQFSSDDVDADCWEYQASLVFSKRWEFLVPYGGIDFDWMGVAFSPGGSNNIESDFLWGVFIGLEYFVTPMVFFSAELHVFTETSVHLGVGFAY